MAKNSKMSLVGAVLLSLLIAGGFVSCTAYKFHIYQKKYGEKMTFWDYIFDNRK